jgi:hypothetical protein
MNENQLNYYYTLCYERYVPDNIIKRCIFFIIVALWMCAPTMYLIYYMVYALNDLPRNTIRQLDPNSYAYEFISLVICNTILNICNLLYTRKLPNITIDTVNNFSILSMVTVCNEYIHATDALRETYIYKATIVHGLIQVSSHIYPYLLNSFSKWNSWYWSDRYMDRMK